MRKPSQTRNSPHRGTSMREKRDGEALGQGGGEVLCFIIGRKFELTYNL